MWYLRERECRVKVNLTWENRLLFARQMCCIADSYCMIWIISSDVKDFYMLLIAILGVCVCVRACIGRGVQLSVKWVGSSLEMNPLLFLCCGMTAFFQVPNQLSTCHFLFLKDIQRHIWASLTSTHAQQWLSWKSAVSIGSVCWQSLLI